MDWFELEQSQLTVYRMTHVHELLFELMSAVLSSDSDFGNLGQNTSLIALDNKVMHFQGQQLFVVVNVLCLHDHDKMAPLNYLALDY